MTSTGQHAGSSNGYGSIPQPHKEEAAAASNGAAAAATPEQPFPTRRWVPGWAYLVLFVLLYSANNAVLAGLMHQGYVDVQ